MNLMAGDIGGTKTTLALYPIDGAVGEPLFKAVYPSGDYRCLEDMVERFCQESGMGAARYAVLGVAGPVMGSRADITNLPWVIDSARLMERAGFKAVLLMNDLEAMAYSIPLLSGSDLFVLNEGRASEKGPRAVIAAGTGLGQAYITWDGHGFVPHASEGGHTEFGPSNEQEIELLRYLLKDIGHVSYERVCSGMGIPNLYAFLKDHGHHEEPAWLSEQMASEPDTTALIVSTALAEEHSCELCRATLRMFVSILGAEAGNLALKTLATGGVYIGGGIPPRILPELKEGAFMESFLRKGRLSGLMHAIPVSVIVKPDCGLLGSAARGLEMWGK